MSGVIDDYLEHVGKQGLKAGSITTLGYRLKGLTRVVERDRLLSAVTPTLAMALYRTRIGETEPDTHRAELGAVTAMFGWCRERGWIRANPFAEVKPEGRKNARREHLRIDEARAFRDAALADVSDAGLAAAMALLMGMRASEVVDRQVRDVDDGARVLWIQDAKTEAGNRHLEVPAELRARLKKRIAGRKPDERLFGDVDRHWLGYHVRRICGLAKVPEVSPHALRRTWSAIGAETMSVEAVSRRLGQRGVTVNRRHYQPGNAEERRTGAVVLRSIAGGRK